MEKMLEQNTSYQTLNYETRISRIQELVISCQRQLVQSKKSSALFQSICQEIIQIDNYKMAWIGAAVDDEEQSIKPLAIAGISEEYLRSIDLCWKENRKTICPSGKAISDGNPFLIQDILHEENLISWRGEALKFGYSSVLALPLISEETIFGALCLYCEDANVISPKEVKFFSDLSNNMVHGIKSLQNRSIRHKVESELQTNLSKLKQTLDAIIQTLERTIEIRDPYTAGHQRRVSSIAKTLAEEIGLTPDKTDGIRIAGIIHDIGKIYVPAEILSSPRSLSPMEFNLVKSHSQVGYDVLKAIEFPWPVATIIKQHHERIDGSGYPNNLKGKDILLEAKILGVADVVEAMASHRPYRPALGLDRALKEIKTNSGILYDPEVVKACLNIFEKDGLNFEKLMESEKNTSRFLTFTNM